MSKQIRKSVFVIFKRDYMDDKEVFSVVFDAIQAEKFCKEQNEANKSMFVSFHYEEFQEGENIW